jgi:hypothetical protein
MQELKGHVRRKVVHMVEVAPDSQMVSVEQVMVAVQTVTQVVQAVVLVQLLDPEQ